MIDYDETQERKAYIDARGYVVLSACPGSGKTTSIVRKLYDVGKYCREQYGRHTGFLCLSFTNKACDELRQKYLEMHGEVICFPNSISTIDSFIMQDIVLPYWYLFPLCKKKPIVVNETTVLHNIYFHKVYRSGKENEYLSLNLKAYTRIAYKYKPEKISIETNEYYYENKKLTNRSIIPYCRDVVKYRIENGFLTSQDALYVAIYILQNHPDIAKIIVKRYPYIMVDEAQDNSQGQFCLLKKLKDAGLENLEMVGDPCQSIYGFRNANPKIFVSLMSNPEWQTLHFKDCRRSNQRIIDFYNKLRPGNIPEIKSYGVKDKGIPIVVYRYDDNNMTKVMDDFISMCDQYGLKDKAIVVRGTTGIKKLAGIRNEKMFYWKSIIPYLLVEALEYQKKGNYDVAFRKVRLTLSLVKFTRLQLEEKRAFITEIEHDIEWNQKIFMFLTQIPDLSNSLKEWTNSMESLLQSFWELDSKPDFGTKEKIKGYKLNELKMEPVNKYYGTKAAIGNKYRDYINTIHSLKGASMDAVLVFLSANSKGSQVSLSDIPVQRIDDMSHMKEAQCLLYVAISRARQSLAIAIPKTVTDEKINQKFSGLKYSVRDL